jgi:hypothetical protein
MSEKKEVIDATYITEQGTSFESKAQWPHENFISLQWKHPEEEIILEFIYFGTYKNRLLYHAVRIEEMNNYLQ